MSAFGTKRTSLVALHMSAFGGKADMRPRSRSSPPDKRDVFLQRVAAQLELRRNTCDVIVDAAAQTALQGLVQVQSAE